MTNIECTGIYLLSPTPLTSLKCKTVPEKTLSTPECVQKETAGSPSDWAFGEGNGNPLQCSCLENPRDGGAWWAAVYGVAQSRTQLK